MVQLQSPAGTTCWVVLVNGDAIYHAGEFGPAYRRTLWEGEIQSPYDGDGGIDSEDALIGMSEEDLDEIPAFRIRKEASE